MRPNPRFPLVPPTLFVCVQNADRFAVFVCSKGKREYIQLLWLMLDPLGQLIPQSGACVC
jgi:hypothetical protein